MIAGGRFPALSPAAKLRYNTLIHKGTEMTKHEIGATIGFYIFVGLMGWALVSFFPLTWGQALIISWMFNKLIDVLE